MFCPSKDKIHALQKSNVVYRIKCPGCQETYIGKTERCLKTRLYEHGTQANQPMNQHLVRCTLFHDTVEQLNLFDSDVNEELHIYNAVFNNFEIVASTNQWSQLEFLEAFFIKNERPGINDGLKASKELQLFRRS